MDADGYIYIEGRSDDMIITGGENVHPGEVEQVLAELPEILESVVFAAPDERWGQRVCAAVVARTPELDAATVMAHCRARLAGYKVPRTVVFLTELPKTATGKITRSTLPEVLKVTT
ncbi:class I adenylate-forming enzyme family protein [Nocardioides alcanivorans]|uniref:class I adenylate-forming enzyme family protein n=1 Tax=Nocardioides alcanivorans TaxID=2897352 RepID=UPI001F229531|nr:fatty acid--CoA ligase family protein [Nocardioides alcanivorans]